MKSERNAILKRQSELAYCVGLRKTDSKGIEGDYFSLRGFSNFLFDRFYSLKIEGELKKEGARVLLPTHQCSLDPIALMRGINDYLAFSYLAGFKSAFLAFFGLSIGGIRVKNNYMRYHPFFTHLKRGSLIVAFPQGDVSFPQRQVSSYKTGIARLVQMHESSTGERVSFVPIGIEYQFPKHLPEIMPLPFFKFPCFGTAVIIRFGEPKYLDGRTPKELTEIVMKEAAELSRIPYKVATPA